MRVDKIKSQDKLCAEIKEARLKGLKIGFTNGCFDIIHAGHVRYLSKAKEECDKLIVAVNSDGSVRRLKGETRPINPQEARLEVLSALEVVDYVTMFEEDTPLDIIQKLQPDILFKGGDWKESEIVGGDIVKAKGGKVRSLPFVDGYSTTKIINAIKE